MRDENMKKQMGLYEIEIFGNANIYTIAVKPNKYFEKFKIEPSTKNIRVWEKTPREWVSKVMPKE